MHFCTKLPLLFQTRLCLHLLTAIFIACFLTFCVLNVVFPKPFCSVYVLALSRSFNSFVYFVKFPCFHKLVSTVFFSLFVLPMLCGWLLDTARKRGTIGSLSQLRRFSFLGCFFPVFHGMILLAGDSFCPY